MRRVLNLDGEYDFSILGISCHSKDYRLYWEINQALGLDLQKKMDGEDDEGSNSPGASYLDGERHLDYQLLSNKIEGGLLIPELPQLDYFMRIEGPGHEEEVKDCRPRLMDIDLVLAVMELSPGQLKSRDNLIF